MVEPLLGLGIVQLEFMSDYPAILRDLWMLNLVGITTTLLSRNCLFCVRLVVTQGNACGSKERLPKSKLKNKLIEVRYCE